MTVEIKDQSVKEFFKELSNFIEVSNYYIKLEKELKKIQHEEELANELGFTSEECYNALELQS